MKCHICSGLFGIYDNVGKRKITFPVKIQTVWGSPPLNLKVYRNLNRYFISYDYIFQQGGVEEGETYIAVYTTLTQEFKRVKKLPSTFFTQDSYWTFCKGWKTTKEMGPDGKLRIMTKGFRCKESSKIKTVECQENVTGDAFEKIELIDISNL